MPIIFALMVSISGGFFVWYMASLMAERRIIEDRIRLVTQSYVRNTTRQEDIFKINFTDGKSSLRKMLGFQGPMSPTQLLTFFLCWAVASIFCFTVLKVTILNKIIISFIVSIVISRLIRLSALKRRLAAIQRELPGCMDLIIICLEAGLALNSAFLRVANELGGSVLGKELKQTFHEVSAGVPLDEALRNFAKRTESPDVRSIVSSIVQAEKLGTALAMTFRVQATTIREKYKMRMKENIAKIPIKILFPLVLFIFPTLFLVILGPAFISIMKFNANT